MEHTNKANKERLKRAERKAIPLIEKYEKMSLDEKLKFIRENKEIWKREHNIINRYYNLYERFE